MAIDKLLITIVAMTGHFRGSGAATPGSLLAAEEACAGPDVGLDADDDEGARYEQRGGPEFDGSIGSPCS